MSKPYCIAVIGKNFGDEGKGLATDYFSNREGSVLVVRHNGGAQSGHTVEIKESDKRFVFHELSSGSFRRADTLWAATYYPDLYKLREETEAFHTVAGFIPHIFALESTKVTILDDVLLNIALETLRGQRRHGSCGMGIWEATLRSEKGYGLTLGEINKLTLSDLTDRLCGIRRDYTARRMEELAITEMNSPEYYELLTDDSVLLRYAEDFLRNFEMVKIITPLELKGFLQGYSQVVFEGGQGLLLDSENQKYAPHVTASRTGLINPTLFLQELDWELDEAVYVTRSYLTRHGAGPFETECPQEELGDIALDMTNLFNEFQGSIRYGKQPDPQAFWSTVWDDLNSVSVRPKTVSLMVTHLNEATLEKEYEAGFEKVYHSYTRYSEDIY